MQEKPAPEEKQSFFNDVLVLVVITAATAFYCCGLFGCILPEMAQRKVVARYPLPFSQHPLSKYSLPMFCVAWMPLVGFVVGFVDQCTKVLVRRHDATIVPSQVKKAD